ncbi:MAG: chromate efflux transporter [Solirubrobacteraceae bacterium]
MAATASRTGPSLRQILRDWGRIGATGFGGPATHIKLLRDLCVTRHEWIEEKQFERALAAVNMLPGPASTQLAIYCAWHLRGRRGAFVAGACFIAPGLVLVIALSALFLSHSPPLWVRGAGMGAGAAVPAVAVLAGSTVAAPMWRRVHGSVRVRTALYALAGGAAAASLGPWLVLVLLACGAIELGARVGRRRGGQADTKSSGFAAQTPLGAHWLLASTAAGGLGALAWTALKVGALAFGGGFVIVPLMQADAVHTYHWMTHSQFLNAVALGQVTPGPVTQTVAAVGYAAHGLPGAVLAALIAYSPSFAFIALGASHFERLLENKRVLAFLGGAAPAAAGAIIGAAIPLTEAIAQTWQYLVLAAAVVALLAMRRGIVQTLLSAGAVGAAVALLGGPVSP